MTRRIPDKFRAAKPRPIKDLLSKAGLSEKQITQTADLQAHWLTLVRSELGPTLAPRASRCLYEQGQLMVWVEGAGAATRARLALSTALLEGRLVLADRGLAARTLKVQVSR